MCEECGTQNLVWGNLNVVMHGMHFTYLSVWGGGVEGVEERVKVVESYRTVIWTVLLTCFK